MERKEINILKGESTFTLSNNNFMHGSFTQTLIYYNREQLQTRIKI